MTKTVNNEPFDLLVLGGGSAGLGVALAAAEKGLRVAVFEAAALGSKTSANSLRIIHGGLRYLQSLNLVRSVESLRAQAWFADRASEVHVRALPCLLPVSGRGLMRRPILDLAALLYRGLARGLGQPGMSCGYLSPALVATLAPDFVAHAPRGAFQWTDLVMEDPDAVIAYARATITSNSGTIFVGTKIVEVAVASDGVTVIAAGPDGPKTYLGRNAVEALGPWFGSVQLRGVTISRPGLAWVRGMNLVVRRQLRSPAAWGLLLEGRYHFFVPRGDTLSIGTDYVWADGPSDATPRDDEVANYLSRIQALVPELNLQAEDIIGVDSGILPAQSNVEVAPADALIGQNEIHSAGRYHAIVSTKYTTMVEQGRAAVARVLAQLSSHAR